jgi:predicted lipoprotein with Yx(FWY)xxD motif
MIMFTPRASSACTSILAIAAIALSGCAAVENKATTSSEISTTPSSLAPEKEAFNPAPNPPPSITAKQPIGDVTLEIDTRGELGEILVDGTGRALYAFSKDRPNEPTCYDSCAQTWLPLLGKASPAGGVGINDAETGTVERPDGDKQVTYKGIPLYLYAGDKIDRDVNGQGLTLFGGQWYVLDKDGQPLR